MDKVPGWGGSFVVKVKDAKPLLFPDKDGIEQLKVKVYLVPGFNINLAITNGE